ncbi:protein phosphatase 1 regulatory subunit 12A-like [Ptychodera flava]|uniref:protein phosphatase 1 regulatory subunit 12A-like n=1 Tax=Ptychodera flava TaxID=63121 RepID=UPI00396A9AEC
MKMHHANNTQPIPSEGSQNEAFELNENPGHSNGGFPDESIRENGRYPVTQADNSNQDNQSSQPRNFDGCISSRREGFNFDEHGGQFGVLNDSNANTETQMLMKYFHNLSGFEDGTDKIDLKFVAGLIEAGADINAKDDQGQTILHEATRCWHTDVAVFLIERGADFTCEDQDGCQPLDVALAVNNLDMIECFLERQEIDEYREYNRGRREGFDFEEQAEDTYGARLGEYEPYENTDSERATKALMKYFRRLATSKAERVSLYYVQHLLENGANINAKDCNGLTVLHEASLVSTIFVYNTLTKCIRSLK